MQQWFTEVTLFCAGHAKLIRCPAWVLPAASWTQQGPLSTRNGQQMCTNYGEFQSFTICAKWFTHSTWNFACTHADADGHWLVTLFVDNNTPYRCRGERPRAFSVPSVTLCARRHRHSDALSAPADVPPWLYSLTTWVNRYSLIPFPSFCWEHKSVWPELNIGLIIGEVVALGEVQFFSLSYHLSLINNQTWTKAKKKNQT